jgi:hypothetical protein
MADDIISRDANRVTVLAGVTADSSAFVKMFQIDSATGRLKASATLSNVTVAQGGTGVTSFTAYAVITGGTTSTGALQQVSGLGSSGQVLTSNGAAALPSWQAVSTTAPVDAQYVTLATNATLSNERVLTGTANQVVITDNGAGSTVVLSLPQSIATSSTVTFGSVNKVTITAPATSATLTLAQGSSLVTSGANSITLTSTGATNVTFPLTGTLATLAGSETLTNKTLTLPVLTNGAINFNAPQGYLINGKISVTVASSDLTLALKTLAGTDPSASDPVYCRIGDTVRTVTAALSITLNDGTNWFNSGSSELATNEVDYFAYLGYNATDGVTIGLSRVYSTRYGQFSATNTNETYAAISTITNAAAGDYYEIIGRFAATLSATAAFTWTVPTFTARNLIQRPIYETRFLSWTPTITGYSANPTDASYKYKIRTTEVQLIFREATSGTSNATTTTYTIPMATLDMGFSRYVASAIIRDNTATVATPGLATTENASVSLLKFHKDWNAGAWTASGAKSITACQFNYQYMSP